MAVTYFVNLLRKNFEFIMFNIFMKSIKVVLEKTVNVLNAGTPKSLSRTLMIQALASLGPLFVGLRLISWNYVMYPFSLYCLCLNRSYLGKQQ